MVGLSLIGVVMKIFGQALDIVPDATRFEIAHLPPGEIAAGQRARDVQINGNEIDVNLAKTLNGNWGRYQQAAAMFPSLGKYGLTPGHVMAVVRNEISTRDAGDVKQDEMARTGQASPNATLGYGQISSAGVQKLRAVFPQLDELLSRQGLSNDNFGNQRALVNPLMIPYLVSAQLARIIDIYEKSPDGVKIIPETIIYGYNADVYSGQPSSVAALKVGHPWGYLGFMKVFPGNRMNDLIPAAASVSTYVAGVMRQYMKITTDGSFNPTIWR